MGGDTDTLATIAMAAASLSDLPNDLSPTLLAELEEGPRGAELLVPLDQQLAQRFGLPAVCAWMRP